MLSPLAFTDILGWLASCMSADVTYAIKGFFPMNIVSFASGLVSVLMTSFRDDRFIKVSLKQTSERVNVAAKTASACMR
jgi:glucose-6-phosphate dehydrogenase assembly protein OpcA